MSVLRSNCCRLTNWHYRVIFPFQSVKSSQNLFNTHKQNNTIYFKVADFVTFTEKALMENFIFCAVLISAKIDFECYGVKI